jgi:8-hydroxy-5-deazaflavin:NADPH oxidoreductase
MVKQLTTTRSHMQIAVLGTGTVGRTLALALSRRGHEVVIGTRNVADTLGRTDTDAMGNPPFAQWQAEHGDVALVSFADAGWDAEAVVNATAGSGSLAALTAVGADRLAGKVLVDVANPLDFSQGMPPVLSVANTDSLAEQLQRAFPGARVVKTLNTVTAQVMVDPSRVPGEHSMFMAGDDVAAKSVVTGLLGDLGWPADAVIDLGGLRSARGLEMYLPLWLSLWGALGTADFNIAVTRT